MINKAQLLMFCSLPLAGCSSDSPNDTQGTTNEISIKAQVWQVMQASAPRRAQTFDNAAALQTEAHFTCTAYEANSNPLVAYIPTTTVDWIDGSSRWGFNSGNDHYYWPATGNLDFFAYMPAEKPSYITGPTYSIVESAPQASFTCADLPMTYNASDTEAGQGSSLQEFVWGLTVGQNKTDQGASGVTMKFRHPFARIKFQLAANHPDIQINSITFKGLKTGGTCTLNATSKDGNYYITSVWSSLTPAEGGSDLVMTLASKDGEGKWVTAPVNTFNDNPDETVPIGGWTESAHQFVNLLVIPQTWAGEIVVNADCLFWGNKVNYPSLTTTIPTNWQPGYSYTYTFNISPDDLIVNIAKFTEQW